MRRRVLAGGGLALAAALARPTRAGAEPTPETERVAGEIARVLKCPVCQNLSVADSPSELAQQMRDLIRRRLEAGESRDRVIAYVVERYGPEVLLEPPREGFTRALWWGPVVVLVGGLAAVARTLRGWARAGPAVQSEQPEQPEALEPAEQGGPA